MRLTQSAREKKLEPELQHFTYNDVLLLEGGGILQGIDIAYTTHGTLNEDRSNVVWVFHALTANSNPREWWEKLIGRGKALDPSRHFIICANVLGGCYGTTGPLSINPKDGKPYLRQFPLISIRDIVKSHRLLADHLNIEKIHIGIGGSLGGQQLLEWAVQEPDRFGNLVPLATNARHSAWGIAFNESQRMAIEADPGFSNGRPEGGKRGLEAARAIAMLSYRTQEIYHKHQTDENTQLDDFKASSYQKYQGLKLSHRFNAHSYYILSKSMDSHHLGRNRKSIEEALSSINSKALVIGIKSDNLFPVEEQRLLAEHIKNAQLHIIDSLYGHDGFLVETKKIEQILKENIND